MNFAQLLEFFDQNNVTFVSITQAFNTNTSMGRLTLNILLSFAQFEREIISERTKDKMAAARKRGQWLGGRPPSGYNVDKETKKLIINQEEAKLIREIFDLYLKGNSLLKVAQILTDKGYRTKVTTSKKGRTFGGFKYGVTQIRLIITSVLYIGKVCYAGQIYDGQQEAIIDEETFKKTQEKLKQNRVERRVTKNTECTGLLTRLLSCKTCGKVMFHTYTLKRKTHKYRYYICTNTQKHGYNSCPTKSVNAQAIEDATIESLRKILISNHKKIDQQNKQEVEAFLSPVWNTLFPEEKRRILRILVKEIDYDSGCKKIGITLNGVNLRPEFEADLKNVRAWNKRHKEGAIEKEPNIRIKLILAHQLQRLLEEGKIASLKQASEWLNIDQSRLSHTLTFLLLSPTIQTEIINGNNQTISLIPEYKIRSLAAEPNWEKQTQIWQDIKEPLSKD